MIEVDPPLRYPARAQRHDVGLPQLVQHRGPDHAERAPDAPEECPDEREDDIAFFQQHIDDGVIARLRGVVEGELAVLSERLRPCALDAAHLDAAVDQHLLRAEATDVAVVVRELMRSPAGRGIRLGIVDRRDDAKSQVDALPDNVKKKLLDKVAKERGISKSRIYKILALQRLCDEVKKRTNGQVEITYHAGGTLLNMKFAPSVLAGDDGIVRLGQLVRGYFRMDAHHVQFNVVDVETLRRAQAHPEQHRDLIVRVAGYSDYFVNLTPALQDEIIKRTEHREF